MVVRSLTRPLTSSLVSALGTGDASEPQIITADTAPTMAALTDAQTPADGYTAGTYSSTAGTIASAVATYYVNGNTGTSSDDLDPDDTVYVSVLVTDSEGNTRTFTTATVTVTAAPVAPTITASDSLAGRTLTISVDSLTGIPTPSVALTVLTLGGVDVSGDATGSGPWSYVVPSSQSEQTVAWEVTATNSEGSDTATGSEVVAEDQVPTISTAPAITGTLEVGETASVSNGTWTGDVDSYAYQWTRDGSNISGATSNTYTMVEADEATDLGCKVTATNAAGGSLPATATGGGEVAAGASFPGTSSVHQIGDSYTAPAGSNRLLVAFLGFNSNDEPADSPLTSEITLSLGGVNFETVDVRSRRYQVGVAVCVLKEADIPAGANTFAVSTVSGFGLNDNNIAIACLPDADQTTGYGATSGGSSISGSTVITTSGTTTADNSVVLSSAAFKDKTASLVSLSNGEVLSNTVRDYSSIFLTAFEEIAASGSAWSHAYTFDKSSTRAWASLEVLANVATTSINSNIEGGTFSVAESGTDYVITISGLGAPYDGDHTVAQSLFATGLPVEIVPVTFTTADNVTTRVPGLWHAPEDDPAEFTPGYEKNDSVVIGLNTETLDLDPYIHDKVELFETAVNNAGEVTGTPTLLQAAPPYDATNVVFNGSDTWVQYDDPYAGGGPDNIVLYNNFSLPDPLSTSSLRYVWSFGTDAGEYAWLAMFPTSLSFYFKVNGDTFLGNRSVSIDEGDDGRRVAVAISIAKNGQYQFMAQKAGGALVIESAQTVPTDKKFIWGDRMRLGARSQTPAASPAPFTNSRFALWTPATAPVLNSDFADLLWAAGTCENRLPGPSNDLLGTPLIDERGDAADFNSNTEFGSLARAAQNGTFTDA